MAQIAVNGTTIYYEEKGKGSPILFIHGMCGDARVWADQMDRLSGRFRCIAYDRRGHTRSPLGEIKERTVQLHANDAASLINALDIVPCLLVGSSGGARIAFDVLRRYPHLVTGSVLSEPPLFALDMAGGRAFFNQIKPALDKAMASGSPRDAVDAFFSIVCPGLWNTLSGEIRDRYRDNHVELFGDLYMPKYEVSLEDLSRIGRPCLIIRGSESHPALRNVAQILASRIPGARFREIAGSGHVTYYEKPTEFASAVASFAGGLKAP